MKLQPGDYVSTKGMTEKQYHAVCKAFMDAGAGRDETNTFLSEVYTRIIWDKRDNVLWHTTSPVSLYAMEGCKRKLTINQILGTKETFMDLRQAYKTMQDNCGIEAGDTVKVLRKAEDYENGWEYPWGGCMDRYIEGMFTVDRVWEKGITLSECKDGYNTFPFFVLVLVEKAPKLPEPIEISSMYSCEFKEDGSIAVGCQTLDFDLIEKIYLTAKEVKEGGKDA